MEKEQIQAIGNFLAYYYTDLNYIKNFQDCKNGTLHPTAYVQKGKGTFYSFLTEYGIKRNISNISDKDDAAYKLLKETLNWVKGNHANDVDRFTKKLKDKTFLTRKDTSTVLVSKILFLNNPWEIIPMDGSTRKALEVKVNTYSIYKEKLVNFLQTEENINIIKKCLIFVEPLAKVIENDFLGKVENLNKIRENRMIDKLLMYRGNK